MAISAEKFLGRGDTVSPREEAHFFESLRIANGVFKTTADHRFDDLNAMVAEQWKRIGFRPSELLDVGASSGITSAEWVDSLAAADFDVQLTASDISIFGSLVRLSPNHQVLLDRSGAILQHTFFGMPLRPWPRRLDYLTGYWLVRRLANRAARLNLTSVGSGRTVTLVSARAQNHPRIRFVEDDVLGAVPQDLAGRFDVIRAANVLNRDYFSDADLCRAVENLKVRLRGAGSFLVVARTLKDGSNHGTLFRLSDRDAFDMIARIGRGSEIEDIVMAGPTSGQASSADI